MISLIALALYTLLIIIYFFICFFIIYHLVKYATISEFKLIMLALFVFVSIGLLFSNILLFSSIDWNMFASNFIK